MNHGHKATWAGLGICFLFSCATPLARDAARPQEPAKHSAPGSSGKAMPQALKSMLNQAHRAIEKGIAALNAGAADEANAWFSQALQPFLEQLSQPNPELKLQLDALVEEIHTAERNALSRSSAPLQESHKTVPAKSAVETGESLQAREADDSDRSLLSQMLDPEIIENEIALLHPTTAVLLHDAAYDFPVVQNNIVDRFANYLSTDRAHKVGEGLENATLYVPMMREILAEKGVPRDLCYLPVIESSYKIRVRSHAAAVGIWQFIESTAKLYGLRVNWWIDERLHPVRASAAAARFLSDLYREFNDWNLVLCAYNAGPGRVRSAIRKGNTRDFWTLYDRKLLPKETMAYVPAFMASLRIVKNPEAYGFANLDYQIAPEAASLVTNAGFDLESMAKAIDLPVTELVELNPFLIRYFSPGGEPVTLFVPKERLELARAFLAKAPAHLKGGPGRYKVQRGDSLGKIANKFGVSTKEILSLNHIKKPSLIRAGSELMIPSAGLSASPKLFVPDEPERLPLETLDYSANRGDTLYLIAKRYQTTIPSILEKNPELDPLSIEEGTRVTLRQGDVWRNQPKSPAYTENTKPYKVVEGDTLQKIAARFSLPLHRILSANQMTIMTSLRPGQSLRIPQKDETPKRVTVHRVGKGETLQSIANKYGISVEELMEWNHIGKRKGLQRGQRLLIYR